MNQELKAIERISKSKKIVSAKIKKNVVKSTARLILGVDFIEKNKDFLYGAFSLGSFVSSISFYYHCNYTAGSILVAIFLFFVIAKNRVPQGQITQYVASSETSLGKAANKTTASAILYSVASFGLYFFEQQQWVYFLGCLIISGAIAIFRQKLPDSTMSQIARKDEQKLTEETQLNTQYFSG